MEGMSEAQQFALIDTKARLDAIELALTTLINLQSRDVREQFIADYPAVAAGWHADSLATAVPDLYLDRADHHVRGLLDSLTAGTPPHTGG